MLFPGDGECLGVNVLGGVGDPLEGEGSPEVVLSFVLEGNFRFSGGGEGEFSFAVGSGLEGERAEAFGEFCRGIKGFGESQLLFFSGDGDEFHFLAFDLFLESFQVVRIAGALILVGGELRGNRETERILQRAIVRDAPAERDVFVSGCDQYFESCVTGNCSGNEYGFGGFVSGFAFAGEGKGINPFTDDLTVGFGLENFKFDLDGVVGADRVAPAIDGIEQGRAVSEVFEAEGTFLDADETVLPWLLLEIRQIGSGRDDSAKRQPKAEDENSV